MSGVSAVRVTPREGCWTSTHGLDRTTDGTSVQPRQGCSGLTRGVRDHTGLGDHQGPCWGVGYGREQVAGAAPDSGLSPPSHPHRDSQFLFLRKQHVTSCLTVKSSVQTFRNPPGAPDNSTLEDDAARPPCQPQGLCASRSYRWCPPCTRDLPPRIPSLGHFHAHEAERWEFPPQPKPVSKALQRKAAV